MRRVVQTRTGDDGNCFAACLASIFGVPIESVPEFGDEDFPADVNKYTRSVLGRSYRRVPMHAKPEGFSTIEGVSPRGGLHACVAHDGELIWDPHPIEDGTGQGLVEPRYYGLFEPVRRGRAKDRADMMALRRNTERQGGPFFIQETEKDGEERTIPVRSLSKGADSGYECQGGCGRTVERRWKNSVCQYCLEERHQEKLKLVRAAKAEVEAARGNPERYKAAVAALKRLKG